ncbi:MAG: hypothetical protein HYY87_03565 [Candidatus Levybacteria bacterium]|nr:hypothetical protein [Candidatus Levybacteria bacterium]MBI3070352.1 hypothetical protein [Candidatus Levybacteria bacterium]MBI3092628.1 hypothetical protein [Candidatus Levybacteria bacterium]
MGSYTTPTWGYKIVSDRQIQFYHVLLPKVKTQTLKRSIPYAQDIKNHKDGSITISLTADSYPTIAIEKVISFFEQKTNSLLETPDYYYKVPLRIKRLLTQWALTFQGCLALMLIHSKKIKKLIKNDFEFINSQCGGLYLAPYTLFLYQDRPKIIHPISAQNSNERKKIEQETARLVRGMIKKMREAQPGLTGLALLSMLEDKTRLKAGKICQIINGKSFGVVNPIYSPFFSEQI